MKTQNPTTFNPKNKPPSCLFTQIPKTNPSIIIALQFQIYQDQLTQIKAHLNTLFAILYLYGQKQHKNIMIQQIKKKMPSSSNFNIENKQQFYQCVKKMKQAENMPKSQSGKNKDKNQICQIFVLSFLLKQLKRNIHTETTKKLKIYNDAQLEILKWAFLYIFQQDLENTQTFNTLSITKMLSKLLNIKCTTKNFYQFQIIELTCQLFHQQNIKIFIQTSKINKTRTFIKQKNIQLFHNSSLLKTKTISSNLTSSSKYQNSQIMSAFKGNNTFIIQAAGNTSFQKILRVQESIEVDDDEECSHDQNSIESIQLSGCSLTETPFVTETNKMKKAYVFGEQPNSDEDNIMDESVAYSKANEEPAPQSYIQQSIAYNKSNKISQQSYMQQSQVISHESQSQYKICETNKQNVDESFVQQFNLHHKTNEFPQKGSQSCSSGKNKANTQQSEKHNIDSNENRKTQFLSEEQMKIISIKSDEIRSPTKKINKQTLDKLYVSNNILTKNQVLSQDEELFTNQITDLYNQNNFYCIEKFDDSLIINEIGNSFDFEENKEQFFQGISIIKQQNPTNPKTQITTTDKNTKQNLQKQKVHFNKIPSQNLLRQTWILQYLNKIEKQQISFQYQTQQKSQCYPIELTNNTHPQTHHLNNTLNKFVVNYLNLLQNCNNNTQTIHNNPLEFATTILTALFNQTKQQKIAQFIQNLKSKINKNKTIIKRGQNLQTYPQQSLNLPIKSQHIIKNVLLKKVGSLNNKLIKQQILSQNPKKQTILTSICQQLTANHQKFDKVEQKIAKSQILEISKINNQTLIKSKQNQVPLQSYFSL